MKGKERKKKKKRVLGNLVGELFEGEEGGGVIYVRRKENQGISTCNHCTMPRPPPPQSAPPTKNLSILVTTVFKVVDETVLAFRLNERGGRGGKGGGEDPG